MRPVIAAILVLSLGASGCSALSGLGLSQTPSQQTPRATPTFTIPVTQAATQRPNSLSGEAAQEWIETTLSSMTLEEKLGQIILSGVDGTEVEAETCEYIHEVAPGGVTFRHENSLNPEQLRRFSSDLQACAQAAGMPPLLTSIAHEGEYVDRFWDGTTTFPAALALGATGDPELAFQTALAQGQELAYSGINTVLGPSADVLLDLNNEVISQRTYGGDAKMVGAFVAASVRGYLQAGVIPVLKHFPGHGGVAEDSHRVQPVDDASLDELRTTYLPPFQGGIQAGAPVMMFDHLVYPALDAENVPATRSEAIANLARQELGFQGVILSDSMRMLGVKEGTPGTPQASHEALEAGVDLLLLDTPSDVLATRALLLDVIEQGQLDESVIDDAVRHVLALKASHGLASHPLPAAPEADWEANQKLADAIGRQVVTLYKDEAGLVPLPQEVKDVLVIGPGDEWELYPMLESALQERGISTEFVHYPPPWEGPVENGELLESIPADAGQHDLTLLFTWQAHLNRLASGDTWQAELVDRLEQTGTPLIVVAIKSPTDILEFPQIGTYLAMFGSTTGQEEALIDALVGRAEPVGKNPLPELVP